MKTYRGSAAPARNYVEADRARADDYYLTEGTGVAQRYLASPGGGVHSLAPLRGDGYEAWVAGVDPDTGVPKGRLRHDDQAVRFVEVTVNGPKTWSLAAELHPDISAAYDTAQDRAANQIIDWLAQHATTRVGPRGGQIQVPVQQIEAATVRHHTSRAGDPHRHLHLQINARVLAEGTWRGLHTVGVRDSLDAINGIGHAAVMTDPGFRAALAARGYSLDPATGEVVQLAEFVGLFSARAAQIGRNVDRYDAEWRAANPDREPEPKLRRAWDARAWADARPDKVVPRDGAELTRRWVDELHELGFREPTVTASIDHPSVGSFERDQAVDVVLTRLGARRSAWSGADIRGEVEQLIARHDVVTEASVRCELAEDVSARTVARCVQIVDRDGMPEHIRALTSREVLDVEADLTARLIARATAPTTLRVGATDARPGLDAVQQEAVQLLAGDAQLVVIEGAAGAGKTTVLAATRTAVEADGDHLMVVTPTRKAAHVAAREVGASAHSAAWLVFQHGYRWGDDGAWKRLRAGDIDPDTGMNFSGPSTPAGLRPGDLLLVDEAGMLDQDTARALLTVADEQHARVALVGDRHQLPAVGRGGVLDLAVRFAPPEAHLTLDSVHRFVCKTTATDGSVAIVRDDEYAQLSLAMRSGDDPGDVFDALAARGQIAVYGTEVERREAVIDRAARSITDGERRALIADTREQVARLNADTREWLIARGRVDGSGEIVTESGQRIGVRDRIATRRNDRDLAVANRAVWTVTDVSRFGITVTGEHGDRTLPNSYVRSHVELAYATTAYGVQGETTDVADLVVGEHTSAASAYVGMTRGRESNIAHLVAADIAGAREQWTAVFARDRADLGPAHAAELAAQEASRYARHRPLDTVLAELHSAWTDEANCAQRLADAQRRREYLIDIVALVEQREAKLPALKDAYDNAGRSRDQTATAAQHAELAAARIIDGVYASLQRDWDAQREVARAAGRIVHEGPGRLGQRLRAVNRASEELARWSTEWQPVLPWLPTHTAEIASQARWFDDVPRIRAAFEAHARTAGESSVPGYAATLDAAASAAQGSDDASREYSRTDAAYRTALDHYGNFARIEDPAAELAGTDLFIHETQGRLRTAETRSESLLAEPTVRAQPPDRLVAERELWQINGDMKARDLRSWTSADGGVEPPGRQWEYAVPDFSEHDPGPEFGR